MTKKAYMKPTMRTVELKHRTMILAGSLDANGMNKKLQGVKADPGYVVEEVEEAW